jgi:hypothetical protein
MSVMVRLRQHAVQKGKEGLSPTTQGFWSQGFPFKESQELMGLVGLSRAHWPRKSLLKKVPLYRKTGSYLEPSRSCELGLPFKESTMG